ncbi:MAG: DUF2807 domain-containing protein [Halieaceae bacterium]
MLTSRKKNILQGAASGRLLVALIFLVCAGFSALVHAATRSVEGLDIDAVVLRGSSEVLIEIGDETKLRVNGAEKELEKQPFYVRGSTLYLGYSESGKRAKSVKYKLIAESLESIKLEGSGTIYVKPMTTQELDVELEGSGDIRLYSITADELQVSVAGSGNLQLAESSVESLLVQLAGSGDVDLGKVTSQSTEISMSGSGDIVASEEGSAVELEISLAGSGDIDIDSIQAQRVEVNIAGSGDIAVWAEQELEVNILGSGDVTYRGDPDVDSSVMGSGDISRSE